ncbi:MAG: hypothetical protein ACI9G1_001296 [Pirellulaceae bacterium]|jgi:hypothetical protein
MLPINAMKLRLVSLSILTGSAIVLALGPQPDQKEPGIF